MSSDLDVLVAAPGQSLAVADDPFDGWTQWSVGCHWSRTLPGGAVVTLSTWQCGSDSGYSLTVNYESTNYADLAFALATYDQLAAAAEGAHHA